MGGNLEPRVAERPKRQIGVVEVNDVRIVVVDELHCAVVEFVAVSLVRSYDLVLLPIPGPVVLAQRMPLFVKLLGVKTFPPRTSSVFFCEHSVVRHSLEGALAVGASRWLIPAPRVCGVYTHTELQPGLSARALPSCYNILSGAYSNGVPLLIAAVVQVQIVVVVRQGHKIPGTGLFIKAQQAVRLPFVRLPLIDPVLEAELARVAHHIYLIGIFLISLKVHVPRVPVPVFGLALRPPVSPDAELCILEPFGTFVGGKALRGGGETALLHRLLRAVNLYFVFRIGEYSFVGILRPERRKKHSGKGYADNSSGVCSHFYVISFKKQR